MILIAKVRAPRPRPRRSRFVAGVVALAALLGTSCGKSSQPSAAVIHEPPPGVDDLNEMLEETRKRHGLPGIAAAVFNTERMIAVGAAGVRKVGSEAPLRYTDTLQIASITKTMTATIVAQLIEAGRLSWERTLAEAYPELAAAMDARYRSVTVEMLLRHSAGLPQWMRNDNIVRDWIRRHPKLDNTARRYEAVKYMLTHPPEYLPGDRSYYTNDAYLLLGHLCERVTGKAWEQLAREQIFDPLGMSSCGFGDPARKGSLDQPWGHVQRLGRYVPFSPDVRGFGESPFTAPYGGIVHGSVVDLAKYGMFHLRGDLGRETNLSTATFHRLHHAPPVPLKRGEQVSAAGFFNENRVDAENRWLNVHHWGYYARGRTLLWFSPQANVGAVVLTNGTDDDEVKGMQPISEVVIALFKRYRSDLPKSAEQSK
jgi:CubicO group peptidase (beta-lactamase class C family)